MIVRKAQLAAFSNEMVNVFIAKTIVFLKENFPEWAKDKNDDELSKCIQTMIEFGGKYRIYKEINIQKLLHYKIEYDFEIPLPRILTAELSEFKLEEDIRVEMFHFKLIAKSYKLIEISLSTKLKN